MFRDDGECFEMTVSVLRGRLVYLQSEVLKLELSLAIDEKIIAKKLVAFITRKSHIRHGLRAFVTY